MVAPDPETARAFAAERHEGQTYGDKKPYTTHLAAAVEVLERFGHAHDPELVCAAWLHDVIEDTPTTRQEVAQRFGERVADLVWAVTNEPGKNRADRALKTYPKIKATPQAVIVKLADRIANVEASRRTRSHFWFMYNKEWPKFEGELREADGPTEMWTHLESLLATEPPRPDVPAPT